VSCSSYNKLDINALDRISNLEIEVNQNYISRLVKENIENSLYLYKNKNNTKNKYKVFLTIDDRIDGSLLATSIRKIEMTANYTIINLNTKKEVYSDSFSRNSLVGPIDSLFSREQSERNTRKRLGIAISNDMVVRLIEWANFN
jgi:hypothetical protein